MQKILSPFSAQFDRLPDLVSCPRPELQVKTYMCSCWMAAHAASHLEGRLLSIIHPLLHTYDDLAGDTVIDRGMRVRHHTHHWLLGTDGSGIVTV